MSTRNGLREVTHINPLMPISVLILTAAQAYKVLFKICLGHEYGLRALSQACALQSSRYVSDETSNRGICIYVEVFKTAIENPITRILLVEFAGLVAVVTLIGFISANRSSAGSPVRWGTTAFLMLMQAIGGAIALPIYYSLIIYNSSSSARASFIPSGFARALLPALVCGYVLPTVAIVAPEIFPTIDIWEWVIVYWQIFPVLVSSINMVLGFCFTGVRGSKTTSDAMISTTFIIGTMDTVILGSFLMHLYALSAVYNQGLGPSDFIPDIKMQTTSQIVHAFFSFDFLGFLVSTWTLIFYDTSRFAGVGKTSVMYDAASSSFYTKSLTDCSSAFLLAIFGTVLLGPGGAAAVRRSAILLEHHH